MKYFNLNENCYLVKGQKNGAIYDLALNKVYSIDEQMVNLLSFIEDRYAIDNLTEKGFEKSYVEQVLNDLLEIKVGDYYDKPYIIEKKKPFTKRHRKELDINIPLNTLYIELSGNCDMNCCYCDPSPIAIKKLGCKKYEETNKPLDFDSWKSVLDDAKKMGCQNLFISGGDPLLQYLLLKKIITYAHEQRYNNIIVTTNGTKINKDIIQDFKSNNVNIQIPIYTNSAMEHEKITNIKGSFQNLINTLDLLKEMNWEYSLLLYRIPENFKKLDEIRNWFYINYDPKTILIDSIYTTEFQDTPQNKEYEKTLIVDLNTLQHIKFDETSFFQKCESNTCLQGSVAISSNGDVLPCRFAKKNIIGNIKTKSLREFYRDLDIENFWDLSNDKLGKCSICEYRYLCHNCFLINNSYKTQETKYCLYDPQNGNWNSYE